MYLLVTIFTLNKENSMSLFYQITHDVSNNTQPGWFLNNKSVRFNTKAEKTFDINLPRYNVPLSFTNDILLKGAFFTSDVDVMVYANDVVDINYDANLVNSYDIAKAEPSLAYNNNKHVTSNIKKNKNN